MLAFKKSLIILISIVTVLALIAVVTGLSPLYWPHPKTKLNQSDQSTSTRSVTNASVKFMNSSTTSTIRTTTTTNKISTTKNMISTSSVGNATTMKPLSTV